MAEKGISRWRSWGLAVALLFIGACSGTSTEPADPETRSGADVAAEVVEDLAQDQQPPSDLANGDQSTPVVEPLELVFEDPPFPMLGVETSFARDVPYGPHEESVFDIFLAKADAPTPLVIFIHGGGFTSGDKGVIYVSGRKEIREFLSKGVSFATINYRLLDETDEEGVAKPLGDSRRCLQFLRYHHEELNVDPARVALYGASAGAGTSLWLAFTDDMAQPDAADPIERESTRVLAAGAKGTQATYDLLKWETVVFAPLGLTLADMAELGDSAEGGLLNFYGAGALEDLGLPEYVDYRKAVDMLALMSPDDPPFWVSNEQANTGIPTDKGELFHHGYHAVALKEQAAGVGLEHVVHVPPMEIEDPSGEALVDFLLRHLQE